MHIVHLLSLTKFDMATHKLLECAYALIMPNLTGTNYGLSYIFHRNYLLPQSSFPQLPKELNTALLYI